MLTTIFVIIALSFLIFIHELGHFLTAKAFGIKVLEFGIGFPPRIWKKKKGETTYSLNLLPFGGFVKILGEEGEEKETPDEREEEKKEPKRSFTFQPAWKKIIMLAGGVVANFIFGWIVISIVFMVGIPEHLAITAVQSGSPAQEKQLKMGDFIIGASYDGVVLKDPIKSEDFILLTKEARGKEVELNIRRMKEEFSTRLLSRENPPEVKDHLEYILQMRVWCQLDFLRV